ncbi:MAG: putative toxin-antitoxin system toxin component, PIN family [Acidobacteria bacterium RIFCSPLOWO2_02_FULL_68_18]|nr:MAG: putative toxin-antitoxin system toxin component, PIN family [Acidobacteria bacterium RIFCSPLOWO2_02_FULL_68_18]OFW51824.1 MAG: putative toxin-antitoxin system toxin component, PIN family [Acidobacteria bacterium RIFCSPLOWO2_12_FULL_68_19]
MLRAVLDANVFVSAYVRPEGPPGQIIERFLRDAAFEIVVSAEIAEEVLQALAYSKVRKAARTNVEAELWFEDILVLSQMVAGEYTVTGVSADPDDDKYIAAAIEGRAVLVVSGDPDLLAIGEHRGVRIVTPRAFFDLLAARS